MFLILNIKQNLLIINIKEFNENNFSIRFWNNLEQFITILKNTC